MARSMYRDRRQAHLARQTKITTIITAARTVPMIWAATELVDWMTARTANRGCR